MTDTKKRHFHTFKKVIIGNITVRQRLRSTLRQREKTFTQGTHTSPSVPKQISLCPSNHHLHTKKNRCKNKKKPHALSRGSTIDCKNKRTKK